MQAEGEKPAPLESIPSPRQAGKGEDAGSSVDYLAPPLGDRSTKQATEQLSSGHVPPVSKICMSLFRMNRAPGLWPGCAIDRYPWNQYLASNTETHLIIQVRR